MGLAEGASSLFGPPTPVKNAGEEQRLRRREEDRRKKGRRSLFSNEQDNKNNSDALDPRKHSKRTWPVPWSAEKLQGWLHAEKKKKSKEVACRGGGKKRMTPTRCCSLDCAARFCSSVDDDSSTQLHNPAFLRKEQAIFATLACEKDRKAFVIARVPLAKLSKGSMMAANTPVCNLAFRKLFGVSETLISACKQTPGARASSSADRTTICATRDHPKLERVVAFLCHHENLYGQKMPNSDESYLYLKDKSELYEEYLKVQRAFFAKDPAGMATHVCTRDYFNKVWKGYFPKLKLKRNGDFMLCEICTLLKEKIHGQAGSRGIQNQAERAEDMQIYDDHVEDVSKDRLYSGQIEFGAEIAKSNGTPWESVYMMVDAANQNNFATPLGASNAHGVDDRGYAERQKIYGVFVAGVIMQVFMIPQILDTGSNMVCTTLYTQFMELYFKWNKPLGDVFIQMDNTVSENKNNHIMGFLAALVARGVMRSVTLCFMMVGHTHIKIDQVFSCAPSFLRVYATSSGSFAKAVKGRNVFSREHLAEVFESAYTTLPVKCRTLESLANFKDLVKPVTGRIYNISKFQAFRISKEGSAIVVKVKKKMHHDDWLGFSGDGKTVGSGEGFAAWRLMRERSVRLEETPPYLLKAVDAEIIRKIEIRQKASWTRLPAAFPGDVARQDRVKEEHADSLRILRMQGLIMFTLETKWMPSLCRGQEGDEVDDDDSGNEGDSAGEAGSYSGLDDDGDGDSSDEKLTDVLEGDQLTLGRAAVARKRRQREDVEEVVHGALNSFGFFIGTGAPLLVGKVKDTRVGMEEEEDEVLLHWYTPSKALVDSASSADFDVYANATFNAAYNVVEGAGHSGSRATRKYVEDTSWEAKSGIIATCPALIGGGKKIPASVKQSLKNAKQRQSQAAEDKQGGYYDAGSSLQGVRGDNVGRPKVKGGASRVSRLSPAVNRNNGQEAIEKESGGRRGKASSSKWGRRDPRGCAGTETVESRASSRGRQPKRRWAELG